jgi:hypothetical protein
MREGETVSIQRRHRRMGFAIVALAAVFSLGFAASATADDQTSTFTFDETSVTVPYGSGFNFSYTCTHCPNSAPDFSATGLPSGYKADDYWSNNDYSGTSYGGFYGSDNDSPLPPGEYTFTVSVDVTEYGTHYTGSKTVRLTVEKTEANIEFALETDKTAQQNVILTATFDSDFLKNFSWWNYSVANGFPVGTWEFSIADSTEPVFASSVSSTAKKPAEVATAYWPGATPGRKYTATVRFVESPVTGNFTINDSDKIAFTGGAAVRPVPTPTSTISPVQPLPSNGDGTTVRLWLLLLVVAIVLGMLTWVTILSIKFIRRRPKLEGGDDANTIP